MAFFISPGPRPRSVYLLFFRRAGRRDIVAPEMKAEQQDRRLSF